MRSFSHLVPAPLLVIGLVGCFPPLPEVPEIERVDAFCDSAGVNWNLFIEVTHPDGPDAVVATWVEVGLAFRDENDEPYTEGAIGEPVDMLRLAGTEDEWSAQVVSDPGFLDCDYPFEYWFLFIAEDAEGNQRGQNLVN